LKTSGLGDSVSEEHIIAIFRVKWISGCPVYGASPFLRNFVKHIQDHTESQHKNRFSLWAQTYVVTQKSLSHTLTLLSHPVSITRCATEFHWHLIRKILPIVVGFHLLRKFDINT
jgi:hypothetical protein